MAIQKFLDWMKVKESTAFTRSREAAAKGLGPSIPNASINSHDTAKPWIKDAIVKRNAKDEKEHKHKKKKDCD